MECCKSMLGSVVYPHNLVILEIRTKHRLLISNLGPESLSSIFEPEEQDYTNEERSASYLNCSNATLMQIAQWMRECLTSHTKRFDIQTVAATRDILPLRLLDLAPDLHTDIIRLESSEPLPFHAVYVTLSHCWGGSRKTTLTTSRLATFQAGVHLSTLPKTFQDAVILTRSLGIRYLWIDALCIIHNSNQEWSHEASLMGDIYANSSFTISATNSPDSEGGLYHSRNPLSVWPCRITAKWDCFRFDKLVLKIPGLVKENAMEPLSWAFKNGYCQSGQYISLEIKSAGNVIVWLLLKSTPEV